MKYSIIEIVDYPLQEFMEEYGISYRKLADKAKMDHTHVYRLIKGSYVAKNETAGKLKIALGELIEEKRNKAKVVREAHSKGLQEINTK